MSTIANHLAITSADNVISTLISLIGEAAAMRLMDGQALGGGRFAFPKTATGPGAQTYAYLAEVVGEKNAERLCKHFDGEEIYIPKMTIQLRLQRDQRIVKAYNSGKSVREIMREFDLSDRRVREILKKTDMQAQVMLRKEAQKSLF